MSNAECIDNHIFSLDDVKEVVQKDFLLFGYVDKIYEFMCILGYKMGWDELPLLPKYNITGNKKRFIR